MANEEQETQSGSSKDELLKQAADALDLAQRREEAVKLAFALVEHGKIPPFESHAEFMEKVGTLLEKDLRVVQEALEMDVEMPTFGKVATTGPAPTNDAEAAFYHALAED